MIAVGMAYKFKWYPFFLESDSIYVVMLFKNNSYKVSWRLKNRWARSLQYTKELNILESHLYFEKKIV